MTQNKRHSIEGAKIQRIPKTARPIDSTTKLFHLISKYNTERTNKMPAATK